MTMNNALIKVRKIYSYIYYSIFIVVFLYAALDFTMLPMMANASDVFLPYFFTKLLMFLTVFSFLSVVIEFVSHPINRYTLCLLLCKLLILMIMVYNLHSKVLNYFSFMVLLAVSASSIDEDKLFRISFFIGTAIIVVLFVLSMMGIVENNRGTAFGFMYRTHYACFLLCMALVYVILKNGWLSWAGELGLVALLAYVLFIVKGKTAFICLSLLIAGIFYRHYRMQRGVPYQENGFLISHIFKIIYLPVKAMAWTVDRLRLSRFKNFLLKLLKYSFIICAGITYLFTYLYKLFPAFWNRLTIIGTMVSRLLYNLIGFEEYPINLFGRNVPQAGFSRSEQAVPFYYAIDGSYAKLLIQYGLVALIMIVGLMTFVQFRLYKKKRYFAMFAIALFALDCIMEYPMINPAYNLFILLAFCQLSKKPGIESCNRLSLENTGKRKKALIFAGCIAVSVLCGCWCFTAYQITSWRGWTPEYNATVVIPDSFLYGDQYTRLFEAKEYLISKEDATCIVPEESVKDLLIDNGIEESRIYVCPYSSIDEMLINADKLISANNIGPRLTICTYDIQQVYIERHAKKLHIPINSLKVKVPSKQYLQYFANEQWRLLWGK